MCFLNCFDSLNVLWGVKGVYSGVSNGVEGVLLASMGGMPGQATSQKVGRPALANAKVSLVCFLLLLFCLLSISVQGNGVCSGASNRAGCVLLDSMGMMPGQAIRQSLPCMLSFPYLSFVKHFCAREWGV